MKKNERIQDLKKDIKKLENELKETKDLLKIVTNAAFKWKRKYKEIKRDYLNLIGEKQIFVNTKPENIVNVEIKGDVIFEPNNNFYNSDFVNDSNIFDINNEIMSKKKMNETNEFKKKTSNEINEFKEKISYKKPDLTKKESDAFDRYKEISESESESLLQELDEYSDVSLQYISRNESNELVNLYESVEVLKKKRKRRKKY